jgi:hypothetical protein
MKPFRHSTDRVEQHFAAVRMLATGNNSNPTAQEVISASNSNSLFMALNAASRSRKTNVRANPIGLDNTPLPNKNYYKRMRKEFERGDGDAHVPRS